LAQLAVLSGMVGPLTFDAFLPKAWPSVQCDPSGAGSLSEADPIPPRGGRHYESDPARDL